MLDPATKNPFRLEDKLDCQREIRNQELILLYFAFYNYEREEVV